ncbi:MAG: AraC family transcriptional regulator [Victivallales bacterium]
MHDQLFSPGKTTSSGTLNVRRVWEVRGDLSYQPVWTKGYPLKGHIVLRTLAGEGYVKLKNGKRLKCLPETLVNLAPELIAGYGCIKPRWSFWWIECEYPSTLKFPVSTVINIRQVKDELETLTGSARLLTCGDMAAEEAAASINLLLRKWHRCWKEGSRKINPGREKIRNMITIMQASAENPLSIATLAKKAYLSEGRFRQVFINATGISPKSYYENLRLNRALSWLRDTEMKLSEIAARLHYSSAFHFSRAFKKHFGKPPSDFRPK